MKRALITEQDGMNKLAIVEPTANGHRFFYVRLIVDSIVDTKCILITTHTSVSSIQFEEQLKDLVDRHKLNVIVLDEWNVRNAAAAIRELNPNRLVVLDGDRSILNWALTSWRLLGRTSFLIMRPPRPSLAHGPVRASKLLLKKTLLELISRRATICLLSEAHKYSLESRSGSRIRHAPDPFPLLLVDKDRLSLRAELGISSSARVLLIAGAIGARKSPFLAIEAIKQLRRSGETVELHLAGEIYPDVNSDLHDLAKQFSWLRIQNRYLSERRLHSYVAASNAVLALHVNDGSSGILRIAHVYSIPVLSSDAPVLRREVELLGG